MMAFAPADTGGASSPGAEEPGRGLSDGIAAMTDYLDRTTEIYQRLLDLGKRKERCLVDSELTELDAFVRDEQQLVAEATQLEAKRLRLQSELAAAIGCPVDRVTVSRLLDQAGAEDGMRLLQAEERLTLVLKDLGEQNELNAALIEQFLAYSDFVLKTLQGAQRQTYDPKGQVGDAKGRQPRVLDRKV